MKVCGFTAQTTNPAVELRVLADRIDSGQIPPPDEVEMWSGKKPILNFFPLGDDEMAQAATIRRTIGGTWKKRVTETQLWLTYEDDTFRYRISLSRGAACRKVITGTTTITEQVPDPVALAAVPTVEVTREVETFEWDCAPVLTDTSTGRGATSTPEATR